MPEFPLEFATRQIKRTFERAIGKSIVKILTELITNSDDTYRRIKDIGPNAKASWVEDPAPIIILFERTKRRLSVIDHGEGLTDKEMEQRFVTYGQDSTDRAKGFRTRSLFGKGLRDVLFTQHNGQVKSIKDGLLYNCRFKWKDAAGQERPVIDIKPPSRVTPELRKALRIPENGTLVEFVLREDVPNPQPEKLHETLGRFYMLRMITSSPYREVLLLVSGKGAIIQPHQLSYIFPELEIKDRFEDTFLTDIGTEVRIQGEIGLASHDMTQGEVGYTDREGGLLVIDEDDSVLDLHLFGFDDDPSARRISGLVNLLGAGDYIRRKLNQMEPEEVLTETRDGFDKQHPFYRQLRDKIYPHLEPVVIKLRELGPVPNVHLSDKTRQRHQEAIDILNKLASEMLGKQARMPIIPSSNLIPPAEGIAFVNQHISIQVGITTPAALLININMVSPNDTITIVSSSSDIQVEPHILTIATDGGYSDVAIKIVRIKSDVAGAIGNITANWRSVSSRLEVTATAKEVLTPVNGLEFERDEYNVRFKAERHLRLYVDTQKIPIGSDISFTVEDPAVKLSTSCVRILPEYNVTKNVAKVEITVTGMEVRHDVLVTASFREYVAGTKVSVVKREKPETGRGGLFKDYRFQPLERKVQTQFIPEGSILINTKDPVNARYVGDDPGTAVEEKSYCQVRLADLILNECLQIMVAQALETGRLDRRFPNNPEIDVRNYVDEKKFEIGPAIHDKFVTKA
jgi:hypothetical protein